MFLKQAVKRRHRPFGQAAFHDEIRPASECPGHGNQEAQRRTAFTAGKECRFVVASPVDRFDAKDVFSDLDDRPQRVQTVRRRPDVPGEAVVSDRNLIPAQGGTETRLTTAPGLNDGPEYDSAGEYIWFNSVRTGLMQAWRMRADGSEQTQMTFDEGWNTWFPHISPDRQKVAMLAYKKGDVKPNEHLPHRHVELRFMNADGTGVRTLAAFFGGQGTINVNSWSPDSERFAFVRYRIRGIGEL